jgi:hypothetical protein
MVTYCPRDLHYASMMRGRLRELVNAVVQVCYFRVYGRFVGIRTRDDSSLVTLDSFPSTVRR